MIKPPKEDSIQNPEYQKLMKKHLNKLAIVTLLENLDKSDRLEVIKEFCRECGSRYGICVN